MELKPEEGKVDDGVDVTLIHWMLSLTVRERIAVLQGFVDGVTSLRRAYARSTDEPSASKA